MMVSVSQSVMGFDFGKKRIGVAVGDTMIGIAHAVDTIHAESNADRMQAVDALVKEWQPALLVIGEPTYENGVDPHPVAIWPENLATVCKSAIACRLNM